MVLRRFFLGFLVVLNLVLAYRIIFGEQGIYTYRELKARHQAMKTQLQAADERSLALSQEIRWLKADRGYTERVIRTEMNFLKENEVLYLFPDAGSTQQSPSGVSGERSGERPGERSDER